MKRREFLGESVPAFVFAQWRGRPLYILLVYIFGQILIDPPHFLFTVLFISFATQLGPTEFVQVASIGVGSMVLIAGVLYYVCSPNIRRFLTALISGDIPDQNLATKTWGEAVTFPQRVVARVSLIALVIYALTIAYFIPRFGLSQSLVGGVIAIIATVALSQVIFLFYLEQALDPVARLALAVGAKPDLSYLKGSRLRLRSKLLLLTLLIIIVPVTVVGMFGYSRVVLLGGDPDASLWLTGLVALSASGIAVLLMLLLIRSVSIPLREIQRVIEEVGDGNLNVSVRPLTTDELTELGLHLNQMVTELRHQERLKAAFGRYVSGAVRDGILEGNITLGGERREVTILFSDIRNFTRWCEQTPPESVIRTLNSYYENLVQALINCGGTVTRYTGDGVLALFGAPLEDPDHALHAVEAAWEAYKLLEKFNAIRRSVGAFELETGFGIHTGMAVVGGVGCESRAEYTPIGDAANVASRIEGLNRELRTAILISDKTYQYVVDRILVGKQADTSVKGRTKAVKVVEVVGLRDDGHRNP